MAYKKPNIVELALKAITVARTAQIELEKAIWYVLKESDEDDNLILFRQILAEVQKRLPAMASLPPGIVFLVGDINSFRDQFGWDYLKSSISVGYNEKTFKE